MSDAPSFDENMRSKVLTFVFLILGIPLQSFASDLPSYSKNPSPLPTKCEFFAEGGSWRRGQPLIAFVTIAEEKPVAVQASSQVLERLREHFYWEEGKASLVTEELVFIETKKDSYLIHSPSGKIIQSGDARNFHVFPGPQNSLIGVNVDYVTNNVLAGRLDKNHKLSSIPSALKNSKTQIPLQVLYSKETDRLLLAFVDTKDHLQILSLNSNGDILGRVQLNNMPCDKYIPLKLISDLTNSNLAILLMDETLFNSGTGRVISLNTKGSLEDLGEIPVRLTF